MVLLADLTFGQQVAYGLASWGPVINGAAVIAFFATFIPNSVWVKILPKWDPQPGPGPAPNPSPPVNVDTLTDEAKQFIERRKRIEEEIATLQAEKEKAIVDYDAKIAGKRADIAQGEALINGVTA